MNQESKLYRISQLFSRLKEQVTILNSNGEFSINIHAENILIKVLNEVYDCDLKNVNYEEGKTYPSIDLRDFKNRIAIQVTSTANLDKVKKTLSKFTKNDLHKEFDKLYVFIITQKQTKYDQQKIDDCLNGLFAFKTSSILDRSDIYKELNAQNNYKKILKVCDLLEEQFTDNKKQLDKWNIYCRGIEEYDLYISNLYNYLDIKGFSPKVNNTLVKINLDKIYVPLELKLESDYNNLQEKNSKESNYIGYSIEKALDDFGKLVILGDPGSGKSTVLKNLARSICSKRALSSQLEEFLPVVIKGSEFAKYVVKTSKQLSEYIIDHIDRKYEFLFTEKLEKNQLILLLDGIDEINKVNHRHDVVNRINSFVSQYPTAKIIVTSRNVGYKETRLNGYFNHFQVSKFKETQIQQFVNNWYTSVATYSDMDIKNAQKQALELFNSIRKNQSVLKMASNPLLSTIIALIHYQGSTLPEKRASLYDIATSTFLENWVRQRDSKKASYFDKDLLMEILAPIAFHIHTSDSTGLISEKILKTKLTAEYKRINPYLKPKEEKQDIKEIIDFLREDAGFLFEKGFDENGMSLFGFVHQTFQEFFTAIEFKTRWKEGELNDNLNDYVFNSNWFEVIKLTASLFKLNEPGRLGRQNATKFVQDITNMYDPYTLLSKPLEVALQILKDDTEIEFSLFIKIIDKVFTDILNIPTKKSDNDSHLNVWLFRSFVRDLLKTKNYQSYLIERILKDIRSSESKVLRNNLIEVLIEASEVDLVMQELIKILKSENSDIKVELFNYSTIVPKPSIIKTKEFREEIVKYINSESFIKNYNGHLPIQYKCSFAFEYNDYSLQHKDYRKLKGKRDEELYLSIRLIENIRIKKEFIDYNVFSWGLGPVENIKEYLKQIKYEYPDLKFDKIENHINELEYFKSLGLNKYPILKIKNIQIYSLVNRSNNFAFVKKNKSVNFFKFPFTEEILDDYFKTESEAILKFLNKIIPYHINKTLKFAPSNLDDLYIFIKYKHTIHWHSIIDSKGTLSFALNNLISNSIINTKILNWIKELPAYKFREVDFKSSISKNDFISNVHSSNLKEHEKLYLIFLVGKRSDYFKLIKPTIQSLNSEDMKTKIKEIKKVLFEVLA